MQTITHESISIQSLSTGNLLYVASSTVATVSSPQSSNSSNTESELPETQINKFLASLYSNSQIPRNVVQDVMDGMNEIFGGNPLGSHSGVHKLCAVYISIPYLPPHIQSTLKTIFLTLLFHSTDRQKFGNNIIFKPLIDELNFLGEQGIDIESNGKLANIMFELCLILGDNLGIHSITGFVESFSANYPCRMCKVHKDIMRKQCYVDETLIRLVDDYNFDLIENNVSSSSISGIYVWNDVRGFKIFDHIEVLNNRIISFDYGPDKGSKPCVLNMDHIRKNIIRLSASEMMSLVRYFGLLIGDFVPQNEPVWYLYLSLRTILDILTSTSFQKECSK
ncbi:CCHC-type domain-containing protein [Aphis craccivora]|uniref:CCHC-type domain-containing protein n=1 Tax=Aphis craccivora TaxID=307492 RepID=A0A6G0YBH3_APHCR|nr:CCHC-type domain-containing protein [Aphis craccivora]